jgi:hypothetical protein
LQFEGKFKINADTSGMTFREQYDASAESYLNFTKTLYSKFSEIDSSNIRTFTIWPGIVLVWVFLDKNKFDFKRIDDLGLEYTINPILRPRKYMITLLDEQ